MTAPTNVLDHIVHLTPPGTVAEATEQWRALGFTVVPGGTHADGLTANALVVLQDGVYVELISFVHPVSYYPPDSPERRARENHFWGQKEPGWIDYAFLGTSEKLSEIINERARYDGTDVKYLSEQPGGRERPDGRVLKWRITAPARLRSTWPFFCGDVTPRDLRVPLKPDSNAIHPSGALGIAHVRLLADVKDIPELGGHFTSIIGAPPIHDALNESKIVWKLATPVLLHSEANQGNVLTSLLLLTAPQNDKERTYGSGLYELAFWVRKDGKRDGTSEETPYAKVLWKAV